MALEVKIEGFISPPPALMTWAQVTIDMQIRPISSTMTSRLSFHLLERRKKLQMEAPLYPTLQM